MRRPFQLPFGPLALAMIASTVLAGCQAGYIARAAYEEGRLLWNRKPISSELSREDLDPAVREKLETVIAVCRFAQDKLGLNVGGAYRTITPVDERAIVWVVMAAPKDSLQPYTWWFPIVGSVPYRGYFDKSTAEAESREFDDAGFDTLVRPAVAFSSLGFFNDPLLSNLLKLDKVQLAGVIIHELFHRTYFIPSDVMFDESAATYVGSAGAVAFFASTEGGNSEDAAKARGILESDLLFGDFLAIHEAPLLSLYAGGKPKQEKIEAREPILKKIQTDYTALKPQLSGLERFDLDEQPINNAVLINYGIYFHDLDNFDALDRRYDSDLAATIEAIIELSKENPDDPFFGIWKATHGPGYGLR